MSEAFDIAKLARVMRGHLRGPFPVEPGPIAHFGSPEEVRAGVVALRAAAATVLAEERALRPQALALVGTAYNPKLTQRVMQLDRESSALVQRYWRLQYVRRKIAQAVVEVSHRRMLPDLEGTVSEVEDALGLFYDRYRQALRIVHEWQQAAVKLA